ncbi:prolyl oligopeptidase family serine peptidase [Streptomyces venezuelae]|uniref:S9 family peptidase n=1 Tax=Streptomyces venezuelae TaxID=54571 RepID=UPI0037A78BFE
MSDDDAPGHGAAGDDAPGQGVAGDGIEALFGGVFWTLPQWAACEPARAVVLSGAPGDRQVHLWTPGSRAPRRLLAAPATGVTQARISRDGEQVWWFRREGEEGAGRWWSVPYDPAADAPLRPVEVPAGTPRGASVGSGMAVLAVARGAVTEVYRVDATGRCRLIHKAERTVTLGELNASQSRIWLTEHSGGQGHPGRLIVLGTEDGHQEAALTPESHPSPTADATPLTADATPPTAGGSGATPSSVAALSWHPHADTLTIRVDGPDGAVLGTWDPRRGMRCEGTRLPADDIVSAAWFPDARRLLLHTTRRGRSHLHGYDPATATTRTLGPSHGHVDAACVAPDGRVWLRWSAAAHRPRVRTTDGEVLPHPTPACPDTSPPPVPPVPPVPLAIDTRHFKVDRPYGPVPGLVKSRPGQQGSATTVFCLHGGPATHDKDTWDPTVAALVAAGFTVVQVNYRGSTGHGRRWRDAALHDPGLAEAEDILAVRDHLVADGVVDARRSFLYGSSWGGYLALLCAGTSPRSWAGAAAEAPVADYIMAYDDEVDEAKAFDRFLFGGSPVEVPERYRRASPLTYAHRVRCPVLIISGLRDTGCSVRQARSYSEALRQAGGTVAHHVCDMGHGTSDPRRRAAHLRLVVDHFTAAAHASVPPA